MYIRTLLETVNTISAAALFLFLARSVVPTGIVAVIAVSTEIVAEVEGLQFTTSQSSFSLSINYIRYAQLW
jgi:hypothetical protein